MLRARKDKAFLTADSEVSALLPFKGLKPRERKSLKAEERKGRFDESLQFLG